MKGVREIFDRYMNWIWAKTNKLQRKLEFKASIQVSLRANEPCFIKLEVELYLIYEQWLDHEFELDAW